MSEKLANVHTATKEVLGNLYAGREHGASVEDERFAIFALFTGRVGNRILSAASPLEIKDLDKRIEEPNKFFMRTDLVGRQMLDTLDAAIDAEMQLVDGQEEGSFLSRSRQRIEQMEVPAARGPIYGSQTREILRAGGNTEATIVGDLLSIIPTLHQEAFGEAITVGDFEQIALNSYGTLLHRAGQDRIMLKKLLNDNSRWAEVNRLGFDPSKFKLVEAGDSYGVTTKAPCIPLALREGQGCPSRITSSVIEPYLDNPAPYQNAMKGLYDMQVNMMTAQI